MVLFMNPMQRKGDYLGKTVQVKLLRLRVDHDYRLTFND